MDRTFKRRFVMMARLRASWFEDQPMANAAPSSKHLTRRQDNRLDCVGVRFDRFALGLASRRPWRRDVCKGFRHRGSREDVEGHGAECKLRFARSALNPCSVASTCSPSSSVLKSFLDCGRHMYPHCGKQQRIEAIALRRAKRSRELQFSSSLSQYRKSRQLSCR